MGSCYKTFRITKEEEALIQEFLDANSLFDFSTLARAAIRSFVSNPDIKLTGITSRSQNSKTLPKGIRRKTPRGAQK